MDTLLTGTVRPVRRTGADGIEPLGNVDAGVHYVERDGTIEIVGVVTLPWLSTTAGADGTGLFREDGSLIEWWAIKAARGQDLVMGGWSFRASVAIDLTAGDAAAAAAAD